MGDRAACEELGDTWRYKVESKSDDADNAGCDDMVTMCQGG